MDAKNKNLNKYHAMPNKVFVSTSYISKSKIVALLNIIFQPLYNCTYLVPSALQPARFFVPPVFWSPQKCHWSLTLVAAVSDFKEGGVDDAGSQRADRQCTYSSRRGWRQAREWRDKGAPSALLAAIVHNLKISWKSKT